MKKKLLLLALLCATPWLSYAQSVTGTIPSTGGGASCVSVGTDSQGIVAISVTGTWTGTLQPQVSIGGDAAQNTQVTPYSSSTAQSTITGNGAFRTTIAGATQFLLCGNTVASGTANVKLNVVKLAANVNAGTGNGNVSGPGSSTANAVVIWNGAGGTTLADSTQWMIPYATDTGSANAIAITVPGLPTALTLGTCVRWKSAASSTGATTITVTPSGQSAYAATNLMKRTTGGVVALGAAGDHISGGIYEACYDGTQYVLMTPSSTTYTAGALTANCLLRGNSNNQIQCSAGMLSTGGSVLTTYNSEVLAGLGVAYIRGATSQKAETTTADANVLTVTPAASAGTYRVSYVVSVSAATSGVISLTASWTDSNGNAQSNIALPLFQLGTAAPNTTFTTSAAGNYSGDLKIDVNNAQANIVVKWVGGGTTTAKVSAVIERAQ